MEQVFSGPDLENNPDYADWRRPEDILEPIEEPEEENESIIAIRSLLEIMFRRPHISAPLSLDSGFRKFVALAWVLRPELCGGESQTVIAAKLGVTRAGFSRLCVWWSEKLGVLHPSMRSKDARESYSAVQTGHRSYKLKGEQARALPIGQIKRRSQDVAVEDRRLEGLRQDFADGLTWRKEDKALLRRRGFITDTDQLTADGVEWLGGGARSREPLESPLHGGLLR